MLYEAFINTIELWVVLAIMMAALVSEEVVQFMQRRADRQQMIIDLEIDRLHK